MQKRKSQTISHRKDALDGINSSLNDDKEEIKDQEFDNIAIEKYPRKHRGKRLKYEQAQII